MVFLCQQFYVGCKIFVQGGNEGGLLDIINIILTSTSEKTINKDSLEKDI